MRDADLQAPMLLDYEVVSAVRGLTLGGHRSASRAEDVLTDYADLSLQRWEGADALRRRAFQLRNNISAYDAAYLVLTESLECPLLTRETAWRAPAGTPSRSKCSSRPPTASRRKRPT